MIPKTPYVPNLVGHVIAFVREPKDHDAPIEDHFVDSFLMKTLHNLAWNYQDSLMFHWVDVKTDKDLIAMSLGIDTLDSNFFPVITLVLGETVYIAPHKVSHTYHNIAQFVEGGYKTDALAAWSIQARISTTGYVLRTVYRKIARGLSNFYGHPSLMVNPIHMMKNDYDPILN
jgi:hypothetical protein